MRYEWQSFLADESGATAIEYGIIAGLIGVAIVASVGVLKDQLVAMLAQIGAALDAVNP